MQRKERGSINSNSAIGTSEQSQDTLPTKQTKLRNNNMDESMIASRLAMSWSAGRKAATSDVSFLNGGDVREGGGSRCDEVASLLNFLIRFRHIILSEVLMLGGISSGPHCLISSSGSVLMPC